MANADDQTWAAITERLSAIAPHVDAIYEAQRGDGSEKGSLYPPDLTADEFAAACATNASLAAPETVVSRMADGSLQAIPYHQQYQDELEPIAAALREAAGLCPAPRFAEYLRLCAEGLLSGHFRASDAAWVKADDAPIDLIVGPMETYLDRFQGLKTSYESCLLRRNMALSGQLGALAGAREAVAARHADLQAGMHPADPVLMVGEALSLGGEFKAIKVRGCSLPNDPWVRENVGVKLTIFEDVIARQGQETIIPLVEAVLGSEAAAPSAGQIIEGYLTYVLMHELGHNVGVYPDVTERLGPAKMPLEEAKASLVGMLAAHEAQATGLIDEVRASGLALAMLGTCLMNIRMAETIPSREVYRASDTLILSGLVAGGAMRQERAGWRLELSILSAALDATLAQVTRLLRHGTAAEAQSVLQREGSSEAVAAMVEATRGVAV